MWLSNKQAYELVSEHGSPLHVYSLADIEKRAKILKSLSAPFGLTVRYAVKANPHTSIINMLDTYGIQFDASSSYEAARLLNEGIDGSKISLSSQQPAHNLDELLNNGVKFVATSMRQLEIYSNSKSRINEVALRINPKIGSGHNNRLTTGGLNSSFGLWHEYLPDALSFAKKHDLKVTRLHVHIGTGADPKVWGKAIDTALQIADKMPDIKILDMGGGYKIEYYGGEVESDMIEILQIFSRKLSDFADKTGRKLSLEIEPGRWLVAHGGCLLSKIVDIVDTGRQGYRFLRTDTGMNDFLRASIYGAQHKINVLNDNPVQVEYVVVGHNCETGDILTTAPHDPERIEARLLNKAQLDDLLVVHDTGAYCASFSTKGYNDFPAAKEIVI